MIEQVGNDTKISDNTTCGFPHIHTSTCPLKAGDPAYIAHLALMKEFWDAKPRCHINSPIGCISAQKKLGFWNYLGAQYEMKFSQYLQSNDMCMKEISEYKYYW